MELYDYNQKGDNIYYVQDDDRPMHVLAGTFEEALATWRQLSAAENPDEEPYSPQGVSLIAEANDVIVNLVCPSVSAGSS